MADVNGQRVGTGIPDRLLASRKELASRKDRASCPTFLGAERHKAKVCDVLLVLIGGNRNQTATAASSWTLGRLVSPIR